MGNDADCDRQKLIRISEAEGNADRKSINEVME
jgi:hypothetical protein